jgi:hypothetical protein
MDDDCRGDTMAKPKSTRKSADKTAAKPGPKSADRTAARPARRERYGITWLAMYRFSDPAWFTSRAATDLVVDTVAASPWWNEVDHLGKHAMPGKPRGSVEATRKAVAAGGRECWMLGRGSPGACVFTEQGEAWFSIDVMEGYLEIGAGADNEVLARLGPAVLTGGIAAVLALRDAWQGRAHLQFAHAFPVAEPKFEYPRVEPRRTASWSLRSIVDIADPTFEPYDDDESMFTESRAIATARPPRGVTRTVHDGVVVLRWADDPRDRAAVAAAAGRHEAWLVNVIPTEEVEE